MKPGQKRKLASDILKLITIERIIQEQSDAPVIVNKCIVVIDSNIKGKLESDSWLSKTIGLFGIKLYLHELTGEERIKLESAKRRQIR